MKKKFTIFLIAILSLLVVRCSNANVSKETRKLQVQNNSSVNREIKKESNFEVKTFYTDNERFSCTVYVLNSTKGKILVDAGHYSKELKNYIKEIGGIDLILLTHGHWDHIYALDEIAKDYPNAKVYIHEYDKEFLTDHYLNTSIYMLGTSVISKTTPTLIQSGEMKFRDYDVEVIHSPGHSIGSVMYYFKDENIMFSGDTIMQTKVGSPDHPTGNEEQRQQSIKEYKNRKFNNDMKIFAGHGNETTYEETLRMNVDLQ